MKALRALFMLLVGVLGGAGAAVYLLQKNHTGESTPASLRSPAVPTPAPSPELEQWKERAQSVQAQIKGMEGSLLALRDELTAVQGWQAKTPSLVRLGQSLALLPAHKATAADAAISAMRFPVVSADCQKLSIINGIGEVFEQRLYTAGIGSYWEVAHLANHQFQQMLRLSDWQMTAVDLDAIRAQALQLAQATETVGLLWEGETPDDFERIEGIGKMLEMRLYSAGIRTYAALATSTVEELNRLLGPMVKKPDVEQWIVQARQLQAKTPTVT